MSALPSRAIQSGEVAYTCPASQRVSIQEQEQASALALEVSLHLFHSQLPLLLRLLLFLLQLRSFLSAPPLRCGSCHIYTAQSGFPPAPSPLFANQSSRSLLPPTRLHSLFSAKPTPSPARSQELRLASPRCRVVGCRETLALPTSFLSRVEHGSGSLVGFTMRPYVYGRIAAG
jgi:hypothetical protein